MATRRNWPREVVDMVTLLALDGLTPPEILRKLDKAWTSGALAVEKLPDLRTIQRWVKELRPVDRSGRWRLGPTDAAGLGFVLTARAELMAETDGRVSEISNETASWLLTVHEVAPDLEPLSAHRVARLYQVRTEQGGDTGDLDAWLGYGPWRNDKALARYEAAVAGGWIKPPPPPGLNFLARVVKAASLADGEPEPQKQSPP
jgi:hypothetical protein